MTAAEHLKLSEELVSKATSTDNGEWSLYDLALSCAGAAHALIAIAIESGVPHAPGNAEEAPDGR